jgi:hypothetical protein
MGQVLPRKPVEVVLEEAQPRIRGVRHFFVLILNVPFVKGMRGHRSLCISDARPLHQAEAIKAAVERALHAYRRPKSKTGRAKKPKTAWARLAATKDIIPS